MTAAEQNPHNASSDGNQKSSDKEISGDREGKAGIANAAKIEDSDDDENTDAERNRMRQQGRNGRDEGADARGNTHGGREDIIRKKRSRGKQTCEWAEIEARYRIGTAARGIGADGLTI